MAKNGALNRKLMWMMVILIGLPLVVSAFFSIRTINNKLAQDQFKLVKSSENVASRSFYNLLGKATNYGRVVAGNGLLAQNIQDENQEGIRQILDPIFKELKEKESIDVLEIGNVTGKVLYRAHDPEAFGDSKKDNVLVQKALSGEITSGADKGESGFALRSVLPIKVGGQIVGTVAAGFSFDNEAVDLIKEITGTEATIFVHNKRVATTIVNDKGERQIGTTQDDTTITDTVLKDNETYRGNAKVLGVPFLVSYQPIIDTKGESIGMLFVGLNQEDTFAFKHKFLSLQLMIGIIGLVVALLMAFLFVRGIVRPIKQIVGKMGQVANGQLNVAAMVNRNDEIKQLADGFNDMADTMKTMIGKMKELMGQVASSTQEMSVGAEESSKATEQITTAIQEIATGTGEQASGVENVSKTMEDLTHKIDEVYNHAQNAGNISVEVSKKATVGEETIADTVQQMQVINEKVNHTAEVVENLGKSSKKISEIVAMITGIADQTNLLALNAAIEAARAGEQGRGFAVVAEEVRKLAEESATAAGQISSLITGVQQETEKAMMAMKSGTVEVANGMKVVDQAGVAFKEINKGIQTITGGVQQVTDVMQVMAQASQKSMDHVESIAAISEETAASTQEVVASTEEQSATIEQLANAAQELGIMTQEVEKMVNHFQI